MHLGFSLTTYDFETNFIILPKITKKFTYLR